MLQTRNQRDIEHSHFSDQVTDAKAPLKHFFLERYSDSFEAEVSAFIANLKSGASPGPTAEDGRRALAIAQACEVSRREGRAVRL